MVRIDEDDVGAVSHLPSRLPFDSTTTGVLVGSSFGVAYGCFAVLDSWHSMLAAVLLGGATPFVLGWVIARRRRMDVQLTTTVLRIRKGKTLTVVPLEEVRTVRERTPEGKPSHLNVVTARGDHAICHGLYDHERAWIANWILRHAHMRRDAMIADGLDPDVVRRAPPDLDALRKG